MSAREASKVVERAIALAHAAGRRLRVEDLVRALSEEPRTAAALAKQGVDVEVLVRETRDADSA